MAVAVILIPLVSRPDENGWHQVSTPASTLLPGIFMPFASAGLERRPRDAPLVVKRRGGRLILADTSTVPHYEKTQRFYVKNGFREVARIPDYYHPGNDRVTFCKKLEDKG